MVQKPTVGRIVLYRTSGTDGERVWPLDWPAVVIAIADEDTVEDGRRLDLNVFTSDGLVVRFAVPYSEGDETTAPAENSWRWPPTI